MAGLSTFLFTDIEGSSTLWEQASAAMRESLARHDALIQAAVAEHNGRIVKKTGDGFLAVFAVPLDAVVAALVIQQTLSTANWPEETGPLKVRIGLHTGESQEREGDFFGSTLNIAARIMDLGHGGQVLLSAVVVMLVRGQELDKVTFTNLGPHELKGLARAERIYQLDHPDLPARFPPLRSPAVAKHNLPDQLASFVGRQREIAAIQELLKACRLVTLTGPGGPGKTRLGLQVAGAQVGQYADGVYFASLAAAPAAAQVPKVIAEVFGIIEKPHEPLAETLLEYFRHQQILLILDNFEHVLDAVSLVTDLLQAAPRLTILTSSRQALRLSGEREYQVPPLGLPEPGQPDGLPGLLEVESIALFVDRARANSSTFELTTKNAGAVAGICRRLDGLPLAIELAAARIKLFTPQQLLERLQNRLGLLVAGPRDLPERQRTLRDTIAWSFHLLDAAEQRLFARLAVFSGGRTLEAVEAVCGFEPVGDPLAALESLLDKSLLYHRSGPAGEQRFYMLETIGEYARERLAYSGEERQMRRRHAEYYAALAETAEPQLRLADQALWMDRLESEHDNLRAALAWLLVHDPWSGLRLGTAIGHFWHVHGHHSEGRSWLAKLLAAADAADDNRVLRAKTLNTLSMLAWFQGERRAALLQQQEGLKLWQELGEAGNGLAMAKRNLAMAQYALGDFSAAQANIAESVRLFKHTGNAAWADDALFFQGTFAYVVGDFDFGRAKALEGLKIAQNIDDIMGVAAAYSLLGHIAFAQHDYTHAQVNYEKSLDYFRQVGDLFGINVLLVSLSNVSHIEGNYELEREHLLEYLQKSRTIGNKLQNAYALSRLGLVELYLNQDDQAGVYFAQCLPICSELKEGAHEATAECFCAMALWLLNKGKPDQAAQLLGFVEHFQTGARDFEDIFLTAYNQALATISRQLEEKNISAGKAAGRAMTVDQAIDYAGAVIQAPSLFDA